ncbi:Molybdate transporter of MFS superfamily protein [Hymenobacter daecheongensis DSM 21074]|uniref:Molybdate transporter of MFS superfamily protein n=1 Tax=Hymenobacter daecheongensis DSM 21074 TaxID=1121955 RepID=A0A1M6APX8_9BACT|nr:putative sulfate/molybdate transporter [Hymenobacter daecheongensis]SHI38388.1 Molybdate transporter of MFS superfamily protein [Hymenobacter daecheongensis DSM 21074]
MPVATPPVSLRPRPRIRFDRNELAGAFGDLGTDLPLLIGIIAASGLDSAGVLVVFGLMQVFSGVWYGMPMPVQPLKAFAALVIAQKIPGRVIFGGGLAIGLSMLVLAATGLIDALARLIPKPVIRGIQFGLALQLATLALKEYVPADGLPGFALAAAAFLITVVLLGNRRWPAALVVIALGVAYALLFKLDLATAQKAVGLHLPGFHIPQRADILTGAVLLALPQIPLSLGNSILATKQVLADHFPERNITVRQISLTYACMNLVAPFFGGFPVCHGSGGLVGHYAFGARTGGSVVLYGMLFLVLGLFFSQGFAEVVQIFPLPILGVLLLFEALTLAALLRDITSSRADLTVALLVGLLCAGLPYGYLVGLVVGTAVYYAMRRGWVGLGK